MYLESLTSRPETEQAYRSIPELLTPREKNVRFKFCFRLAERDMKLTEIKMADL